MAKHDVKMFSWDPEPNDYQKNRIKELQKQLENAHRVIEMKDSHIDKLEQALAKSADRCARLEKAFLKEALNNVQMS